MKSFPVSPQTKFIAGLFCSLLWPATAAAQTWQYHSTSRFVIAYSPEQEKLALQILDEAQTENEQLAQRLQFTPNRTITVYLCPTQSSFDRITGGIIPHWGEAAADPSRWRIFLKSLRLNEGKQLTIKHELAHLLLAELAHPQRVPRWFNEGAAILLAGETQHLEPALISRAMATNSLLTFDEIEAMLSFPNELASLAYSESYHAVNFLVRRYRFTAITKFAQALAQHPDARAAFQNALGEDLWDFEAEYFDYVRKNFRWYFLLDESLLWGAGIFLLFIAAYVVTRIRTHKKVAEWEEEEQNPPQVGEENRQEEKDDGKDRQ